MSALATLSRNIDEANDAIIQCKVRAALHNRNDRLIRVELFGGQASPVYLDADVLLCALKAQRDSDLVRLREHLESAELNR